MREQFYDDDDSVESKTMEEIQTIALENAARGFQYIQDIVHKTANDAGWHKDPATGQLIERNFGEAVALMHSELSKALEANRKNLMDDKLPHLPGEVVEFADAVIRIMDTCAAYGYDLAGAIIEKNEYNRQRADHKLENRAKAGGKRY